MNSIGFSVLVLFLILLYVILIIIAWRLNKCAWEGIFDALDELGAPPSSKFLRWFAIIFFFLVTLGTGGLLLILDALIVVIRANARHVDALNAETASRVDVPRGEAESGVTAPDEPGEAPRDNRRAVYNPETGRFETVRG